MAVYNELGSLDEANEKLKFLSDFQESILLKKYEEKSFFCGSASELPMLYAIQNITDFDYLMYRLDVCAVPIDAAVSKNFKGTILDIHTSGEMSGFARLKERGKNSDQFCNYWSIISDEHTYNHGPASKFFIHIDINAILKLLPVAKQKHAQKILTGFFGIAIDQVYVIRCPYWPPEAEEWKIRLRSNGWPSYDMIKIVVKGGCYLVRKAHPSTPEDDKTQWRFSFSKAELILIRNWNNSQKFVYHILRRIKNEIVRECGGEDKTILCTYYFKTLMLWACEKNSSEFWEEDNLETSVGELLCTMIELLIEKDFPNYFIPTNNMVVHLSIEDLERGINLLLTYTLHYRRNPSHIVDNTPKMCTQCQIIFTLPDRLAIVLYLISARFSCDGRQIKRTGSAQNTFKKILYDEMCRITEGIFYQMQLAKAKNKKTHSKKEVEDLTMNAESCLRRAFENQPEPCEFMTSYSFSASFDFCTTLQTLSNGTICPVLQEISEEDSCLAIDGLNIRVRCTRCDIELVNDIIQCVSHQFFTKFVYSNYVKPRFMISLVNLANFYYTGKCDYKKAYETSKFYNSSWNSDVGHFVSWNLFPVLFDSEWSALFDDSIQAVLGFLSLFKSVITSVDNSNVDLPCAFYTCPKVFLTYIQLQSLSRLGKTNEQSFRDALKKFHDNCYKGCGFNDYLGRRHWVPLAVALRISGIETKLDKA